MASTSGANSKLDYLKKYMSSDKDPERLKRKKKKAPVNPKATGGIVVVDSDITVRAPLTLTRNTMKRGLEVEVDEEEGPTIAEIIDEAIPKGMQALVHGSKWKSIADTGAQTNSSSRTKARRASPDSDLAPPRRQNQIKTERRSPNSDISPPRQSKKSARRVSPDSDVSPPRRNSSRADRDLSPVRNRGASSTPFIKQEVMTPIRQTRPDSDEDLSPIRNRASSPRRSTRDAAKTLPTKTLSGMSAGLQNAKTLRLETERRRRDEESMFRKMDAAVSGRDTQTVYRDKKTGKRRDMIAEGEEEAEKELRKRMHEDKFKKWGKGLVQQEKQDAAVNEAMHEMSKPLARFVDDSDRDAHLKAIDREGDPMLEYLSKKKTKESKAADVRPKYKGSAPMNRYGVLPGYRWDGVDRSNGFEKERFNRISNRVAVKDQAYKWSTEDM